MSNVGLELKEVKCRKRHLCEWCEGSIPAGNYAIFRKYIYEGVFGRGWMHNDCYQACVQVCREYADFEWTPGDFERGSTELN